MSGVAGAPGVDEGVFEVGEHAVLVEQDDHGDPGRCDPQIVPERSVGGLGVGLRAGLGDDAVAAAVLPRFGGDEHHAVVVPGQRFGAASGALAGSMSRSRVTWGGTVARALARRSRTARATGRRGRLAGRREYGRAGPEDALAVEDAVLVEVRLPGSRRCTGVASMSSSAVSMSMLPRKASVRCRVSVRMILPPVAGRACSAQLARKWPGWGQARGRRRGAWWTYGGDCMPRFGVLVLVMCVGGVLVAGVLGSSAALATPGSQVEVPIRRWGEKVACVF